MIYVPATELEKNSLGTDREKPGLSGCVEISF